MQRQRTRRSEGLANDERILDAAVALLDEQGADGFGVADVARASSLTSGAFYARYADLPELLADLWIRRASDTLTALARDAATLAATWPRLEAGALAALLESTRERRVAFELMAVTARVDELGDVVPASVADALAGTGLAAPDRAGASAGSPGRPGPFERGAPGSRPEIAFGRPDVVGLGLLALALGSAAHGRVDSSLADAARAMARWVARGERSWSGPAPVPTAPGEIAFVPGAPDAADAIPETELRRLRLLDATAQVVARSGIGRANLRRISRASGYAHTAVYQEYPSLRDLLVDFVREVATGTVRAVDPSPARHADVELEAGWLAGIASPGGRSIRRLSLEFLVAAAHDPTLAELISAADRDRNEAIAHLVADDRVAIRDAIVAYRYARRAVAFGLAALEETAGGLDGRDWRPFLGTLLAGALGTDAGDDTGERGRDGPDDAAADRAAGAPEEARAAGGEPILRAGASGARSSHPPPPRG